MLRHCEKPCGQASHGSRSGHLIALETPAPEILASGVSLRFARLQSLTVVVGKHLAVNGCFLYFITMAYAFTCAPMRFSRIRLFLSDWRILHQIEGTSEGGYVRALPPWRPDGQGADRQKGAKLMI